MCTILITGGQNARTDHQEDIKGLFSRDPRPVWDTWGYYVPIPNPETHDDDDDDCETLIVQFFSVREGNDWQSIWRWWYDDDDHGHHGDHGGPGDPGDHGGAMMIMMTGKRW